MRPLSLLLFLVLGLTNCNQSKERSCNFIKTELYETGKIKTLLSVNSSNIRNGECFYFGETGFLDSSVTFSNDILEGLKKIFYDVETYTYEYHNGHLIKSCVYDSLNVLKYQTPLDIKKIGKTQLNFFSKQNFIEQNKVDTFTIANAGLPPYNRSLAVIGAVINSINDHTFTIRTSKHTTNLKPVTLWVKARQNISDSTDRGVLVDSITIRVK